jgi:hypothetical protein
MKHLNVIINPVKRWFHYDKPLPVEMPKDMTLSFVKDHKGNDVIVLSGWATYKCEGAFYNA